MRYEKDATGKPATRLKELLATDALIEKLSLGVKNESEVIAVEKLFEQGGQFPL